MSGRLQSGKRNLKYVAFLLTVCLETVGICTAYGVPATGEAAAKNVHDTRDEALLSYQDIDYDFSEDEIADAFASGEISCFSLLPERAQQLPSAYGINAQGEILDLLPAMRTQGSYGNCWAYSALGASEAGLIRRGYADKSIDLSERHLTYYFYQKGAETADPLGLTRGDYNANSTSTRYWDIGGNSLLTIWHMASWCGPVPEAMAPYSLSMATEDKNGLMGQENSTATAYEMDACHLENAYVIPIGNSYQDEAQRDTVKRLIMEYGALGMSYYAQKTNAIFDNKDNNCYYNDTYTSTNHAIQVIGWDDHFSAENFNEGHRPQGDGAWLMKNCWGAEGGALGQNGFFWLSYYDYSLRDAAGSTTKYAYVYDCVPADDYDLLYQHDGDAGHKRFGNESGTYYGLKKAANVFTVSGNSGKKQYLKAVGIGESKAGISYRLSVYTGLTDPSDPTKGTPACSQEGVIEYNGYHTIPLDEPVCLSVGEVYSVVFEFTQNAGYVYASRSFTLSPWKFVSESHKGESFFVKDKSSDWLDCADNSLTAPLALRIKAYCSYEEKTVMSDSKLDGLSVGEERTLSVSTVSGNLLLPQTVSGQDIPLIWESSNEAVAYVTAGEDGRSARLTVVGEGVCRITARTADGRQADCYVSAGGDPWDEYLQYDEEKPEDPDDPDDPNDPNAPSNPDDPNNPNPDNPEEPAQPGDPNNPNPDNPENPSDPKAPDNPNNPNNPNGSDKPSNPNETDAPALLTGITLKQTSLKLAASKKAQLEAIGQYSKENKTEWRVYWKSSDDKVATVDESGRVTAKKAGKAVITVYNGNIQAECAVTVVPAKVTGGSATYKKNKTAVLSWKKQKGVDGYQLCRAKAAASSYQKYKTITSASETKLTCKALYTKGTERKAYYYKVRAYKKVGGKKLYGAWSKPFGLAPGRGEISSLKKLSAKKIKLTYRELAGVNGYRIYRKEGKEKEYHLIAVVKGKKQLSYVDRQVKAGRTYHYKICGYKMLGGSVVRGQKSKYKEIKL